MTRASWAKGSGQWARPRTVIVVGVGRYRAVMAEGVRDDTEVVGTPLDLIRHLEDARRPVSAVVLMGPPPLDRELATFLRDSYPSVVVVDDPDDSEWSVGRQA